MSEIEDVRRELVEVKAKLAEEKRRVEAEEEMHEKLKKQYANLSVLGETEEEYISNKLMSLLQNSKADKQRLALQIEQEEEYLTNTLQMKLEQLKREKVEIENQMEQEQEYIVNKLQIQLDETRKEKEDLERKIEELSRLSTTSTPPLSPRLPRSSSGQQQEASNGAQDPRPLFRTGSGQERPFIRRSSAR